VPAILSPLDPDQEQAVRDFVRSEIRLLRWRQVDFVAKILTVGKSKSPTGTGRTIPLNSRILSVLEMWDAQFLGRQPAHFVFPSEKYGAAGQADSFGFTAGPVATIPTRPGRLATGRKLGRKPKNVLARF
jgi:integrase